MAKGPPARGEIRGIEDTLTTLIQPRQDFADYRDMLPLDDTRAPSLGGEHTIKA